MSKEIDVVIIGAGTAGLSALREVRKRTQNFVIVNDGPWGTVCARVGCMPSKVLIEAANAYHRRTSFTEFGISGAEQLAADMPAVLRRVRRLRDDFVRGTLKATDDLGKRVISGRARLLGPGRVEVNGRELRARRIIIATGSHPVVPAPWRALGGWLLTSDTLFEQENLPARIAVIGLGAIGVEIAQALSRLGVDVAGFDGAQTVAGLSDLAVNDVAVELLRREFPLHLGANAELTGAGDGVRVRAGDVEVTVDRVVAALGRRPNVNDIGLETLGVELDKRGLPAVNRGTQQIGDLPVFLAGDANGHAPLLHEAADEGHIAGLNATRDTPACFERRAPLAIVFADPNVAAVGKRFQELGDGSYFAGEVRFDNQGRARAAQHNRGILRVYAARARRRAPGAPAGTRATTVTRGARAVASALLSSSAGGGIAHCAA